MHIIQVIREANQVDSVYFLLTAYIEAVWHEPTPRWVPDAVLELPLKGRLDVAARWEIFHGATVKRGNQLSQAQRDKVSEALEVFRCAAERLQELHDEGGSQVKSPELCAA